MPAVRTRSTLSVMSVALLAGSWAAPAAGAAVVTPTGGDVPGDHVQVTLWRGRPITCPDSDASLRPGALVTGGRECFRLHRQVMAVEEPRDVKVFPGRDGAGWQVVVTFNDRQRREFARVTAAALGHELAILDGHRLISAPTVMDRITAGKLGIVGLTRPQARHLADDLRNSRSDR